MTALFIHHSRFILFIFLTFCFTFPGLSFLLVTVLS